MKILLSISAAFFLFFSMSAEVFGNNLCINSYPEGAITEAIQPPGESFLMIVVPTARGYKVSGLKATRKTNPGNNEILASIETRDNRIFVHISKLGIKMNNSKNFLIFPKGFKLSPQASKQLGYKSVVMSGGSTMLTKNKPLSYVAVMTHPY